MEAESLFRRVGGFVDEVMPVTRVASPTGRRLTRPKLLPPVKGPKFWFMLTVILPTLLAFGYYYTIASDMFMSEAKFIVKAPDKSRSSGMPGSDAAISWSSWR